MIRELFIWRVLVYMNLVPEFVISWERGMFMFYSAAPRREENEPVLSRAASPAKVLR